MTTAPTHTCHICGATWTQAWDDDTMEYHLRSLHATETHTCGCAGRFTTPGFVLVCATHAFTGTETLTTIPA